MHSTVTSETKRHHPPLSISQPTLGETGRSCKWSQNDHVTYEERCGNMLLREHGHPGLGRSEEAALSRKNLNLTLKEG